MIKILEYKTTEDFIADRTNRGFRSLTNEWKGSTLFVTWVSGTDDPANTPPARRTMTESEYVKQSAARDDIELV